MKILDNEGELIVNLTDVKDEQHLQTLLDKEDNELTEVMFDTPFFAMSLKEYKEQYGEEFETVQDEQVCTYEEWMSEVREWAKSCLADCE
jgi:hypothetical protein